MTHVSGERLFSLRLIAENLAYNPSNLQFLSLFSSVVFNVDYVDVFKRLRQNDMYVVNAPQRQMQQFEPIGACC